MEIALVIPISNAEAKCGFSVLNYIRSDRRKTLTGMHLEDIIRINMNGPLELDRFGVAKYAEKWLKEGHKMPRGPGN